MLINNLQGNTISAFNNKNNNGNNTGKKKVLTGQKEFFTSLNKINIANFQAYYMPKINKTSFLGIENIDLKNALNEVDLKIKACREAQAIYGKFNQSEIDAVFEFAAMKAARHSEELATLACQETKKGVLGDKIVKNLLATAGMVVRHKGVKTVGILDYDRQEGIAKVGEPFGIIAALTPVTNPTSTALFKASLALKTGNGIIIAPHPSACDCTKQATEIIGKAAAFKAKQIAQEKGLPQEDINKLDNLICCLEIPEGIKSNAFDVSKHLMSNADLVLATGGGAMVKAAYSSGKPAIGVGPGNTPVLFDETADIKSSVKEMVLSKVFDNSMICTHESTVMAVDSVYDQVKDELIKNGAFFISNTDDKQKIRDIIFPEGKLNASIVGKDASEIAKLAGIQLPEDKNIKLLVVEVDSLCEKELLTGEKLCPVLAMHRVRSFEEGLEKTKKLLDYEGKGHTAVLHSLNKDRIKQYSEKVSASRLVFNTGSLGGCTGLTTEAKPSLTLGCGIKAGNIFGENTGPENLVNLKYQYNKTKPVFLDSLLNVPPPDKISVIKYDKTTDFFGPGAIERIDTIAETLKQQGIHRLLIVTDKFLNTNKFNSQNKPVVSEIIKPALEKQGIEVAIYDETIPNPTIKNIDDATKQAREFGAQAVLAVGGGSPIDTAKSVAVLLKNPERNALELYSKEVDPNGAVPIVVVNTTHGTGSEFTQFSVATIPGKGEKPIIFSRLIRPEFSIDDPSLMLKLPKTQTIYTAVDTIAHSLEAATTMGSIQAGEHKSNVPLYSIPFARTAIDLVAKNLPVVLNYIDNPDTISNKEHLTARHNLLYGSMLGGQAFDSKGFLHLGHALEHPLSGIKEDLPHGLGLGMLLPAVIEMCYKNPESAKIASDILKPIIGNVAPDSENAHIAAIKAEKWLYENGINQKLNNIPEFQLPGVVDKLIKLAKETPGLDNLLQCSPVNPTDNVIREIFEKSMKPYEENRNLNWKL